MKSLEVQKLDEGLIAGGRSKRGQLRVLVEGLGAGEMIKVPEGYGMSRQALYQLAHLVNLDKKPVPRIGCSKSPCGQFYVFYRAKK